MMENELITDMWKRRMKDTLQMIYRGKLNEEALDRLLEAEVEKSRKQGTRYAYLRDIYRNRVIKIDLNEIMSWVSQNRLIVGANGAFSYAPQDVLGDTSVMVIGDLDARAAEKKLAKEFEKNNMLKEANLHDNLQTKYKQDTNSTYGIACMPGSFLFSPDSATYITTQARQLIAEMMWSFERFLVNNLQFQDYNEAMLYFNCVLNEERHYEKYKEWLDYIPTTKDIIKYVLSKLSDIKDFNNKTKSISRSMFIFLNNLTEEERVYLYYKFNFINFIEKNSKVMNLFKQVADGETAFLDPNKVPEEYRSICNKIIEVCEEFCYCQFMTSHRVDKYFDCDRKAILLSDTDSVFIILGRLMDIIYNKIGFMYRHRNNDFKMVNTLCTLCTHFIRMRHDKYVEACNIIYRFPDYNLNAKNEFYYKRVVLFTGIKKNYSGLKLLREGNIVPPKKQISHTGIKLTGSRTPKQVSDFQTKIIEENILRAQVIDPINIMNEINEEKNKIIDMIKHGDKSMGIPQRFSGYDKYKVYESAQICRLVEIWNRIYPEQKIGNGEYLMTFETKVHSENQLYMIQDEEMREKIRKAVYGERWDGEDNFLRHHGLSTVGIPRDGAITTIPQWMIDIIDFEVMARKHLSAITDLLPSLNMNKVKTKDFNTYSSLLKIS